MPKAYLELEALSLALSQWEAANRVQSASWEVEDPSWAPASVIVSLNNRGQDINCLMKYLKASEDWGH